MEKNSITTFYRRLLFLISIFTCLVIFIKFIDVDSFNKKEVLGIMVSVSSIIVAIVITYLFSKLFSEKSIRIERKKELDELSKKITYLRRIAFQINKMHEFWKTENRNLKTIMDNKYKDLTYEVYRGYNINNKLNYDEIIVISEEIGSAGQAYLAFKGLEDEDNSFSLLSEFNPRNYTIDEVSRYYDYSCSIWNFLDRGNKNIYNFEKVNRYYLNEIDELYYKIKGKSIKQNDYWNSLKDLFGYYEEDILKKHLFLNQLNSDSFPYLFKNSFYNMFIFLILLIFSIIIYVIDIGIKLNFFVSILFLSIFISNIIDLIFITFQSIKDELDVKEVFRI